MASAASTTAPDFGDRYRVERTLGRGGMATVFLCVDTKFDRRVAIKLLHPDLAAAVGAERFHREIKIATALTHPNILPAYDSGEADGSLYYVMPFVEGESLRDRLTRERQLPVQDAVRITTEIASALQYAHQHGIVHRDIKPENILLESDHAVLADFGIARAITASSDAEALTQTGMSLGTPSYMSPEQALGEKHLDGRSDQYALACVTYEMLTGQPPFLANTMQALVAKHLGEPVPLITTTRPAVPDELEDVVLRALEKVPADRFQSMQEFADALNSVIATTGTWARRTGTNARLTPLRATRGHVAPAAPTARIRKRTIGAAVAATAVIGLGFGGWHLMQPGASGREFDAKSIGVLYFQDLSGGRLRHVADGLTESLIDQLSQVPALVVTSRNGVLPLRGTSLSADSIGRLLKVGSLVEGTVEPAGAQVKVDVRLIEPSSGTTSDRASFTIDTTGVLALQDTVAAEVAAFLRKQVGEEVRLREQRMATRSNAAWLFVQRAERYRKDADSLVAAGADSATVRALASADSLLAAAEHEDDRWPTPPTLRAAVALATAQALSRQPARLPAVVDSGVAYAQRALTLDPRDADALEIKGKLEYFSITSHLIVDPRETDRMLARAESTLTRAVTVNQNQAGAWDALSALYYRKPDLQAVSLAAFNAYKADSYLRNTKLILQRLFLATFNLEQWNEAMKWLDEFHRRFPNDRYYYQGRILMYRTRYAPPDIDSAWTYYREYIKATPEKDRPLEERKAQMLVAGALANAGLADSARQVLLHARTSDPQLDVHKELPVNEAAVRVMLGTNPDKDIAVDLLKDYLTVNPEHRKGFVTRVGWYWRDLQDYPRFKQLIVGLR